MTQISLDYGLLNDEKDGASAPRIRRRRIRTAYPRHYAWVLMLAVLDVLVTCIVLRTGGTELNAVARWAIEHAGIIGMVLIKATTLAVVLAICEYLARHRPKLGLRIVELALIGNSAAVACGLIYLTQFSIVLIQWTWMQ